MRILILHNRYRQAGGEDRVVQDECAMLSSQGHTVERIEFDNDNSPAQLALNAAWSRRSRQEVAAVCARFQPDIAHVHNFWIRLSPAVHSACRSAGVPTVQTLHNYRLVCVNALLLRDGKICEDCLGRSPWRGVARRCYHDSLVPSAAVAAMIAVNRARHTWDTDVSAFVAPSRHCADTLVSGGIDARKLFVKPHFTPDPGEPSTPPSASNTALYIGRLSAEKGLPTLLRAWSERRLSATGVLRLVGDGPELAALERQVRELGLDASSVQFLGGVPSSRIPAMIASARCVVAPSLCYETFGRSVMEAFAGGRGVVASAIGAIAEAVEHGKTGLACAPGDSEALGQALESVMRDDALADAFGMAARRQYLARYTPETNYRMLMDIYRAALAG
jgi:glycosyltransferase involved in cell wall biosynthesis